MLSASLPAKEIFISVLRTDRATYPRQLETSGLFGTQTEDFQHPSSFPNYHNIAKGHLRSAYCSGPQDGCSINMIYKLIKVTTLILMNPAYNVKWVQNTHRKIILQVDERDGKNSNQIALHW